MVLVDVTAVSPAPQPGWAATETAGVWTFAAPIMPVLTPSQLAAAAVSAGVAITSTSTPALNATYAVDPLSQGRIASISTYILVNGNFPGASASYPWLDMSGAPHVFPSTAAFQAFATSVANYIALLDFILATNAGTLPPATAALA
jgi:hypothetical protein